MVYNTNYEMIFCIYIWLYICITLKVYNSKNVKPKQWDPCYQETNLSASSAHWKKHVTLSSVMQIKVKHVTITCVRNLKFSFWSLTWLYMHSLYFLAHLPQSEKHSLLFHQLHCFLLCQTSLCLTLERTLVVIFRTYPDSLEQCFPLKAWIQSHL